MSSLLMSSLSKLSVSIKQALACGAVAIVAGALCAAPAGAAEKKAAKSAKAAKSHFKAVTVAPAEPNEADPDITDTTTTEFKCELGNLVTIYQNEKDDSHIALRWKKRLHRLERIGTTTGAKRFENTAFGLIWIGIPSKGMLLDSRQNRQLANECQTAEQAHPTLAPVVATPDKPVAPGAEPVPAGFVPPVGPAAPGASGAAALPSTPSPVSASPAPASAVPNAPVVK